MVFTFLENALNLGIFSGVSVLHSKLQAEFFENLIFPTTETGGEIFDLLYQNSLRKYKYDLQHGYLYFV